jgi:hypothetical protein
VTLCNVITVLTRSRIVTNRKSGVHDFTTSYNGLRIVEVTWFNRTAPSEMLHRVVHAPYAP